MPFVPHETFTVFPAGQRAHVAEAQHLLPLPLGCVVCGDSRLSLDLGNQIQSQKIEGGSTLDPNVSAQPVFLPS